MGEISKMMDWKRESLTTPDAPHIGHMMHLCDMAEHGSVTLDQMKALTKDAKFICNKCGRAAAKAENLCEPVPL